MAGSEVQQDTPKSQAHALEQHIVEGMRHGGTGAQDAFDQFRKEFHGSANDFKAIVKMANKELKTDEKSDGLPHLQIDGLDQDHAQLKDAGANFRGVKKEVANPRDTAPRGDDTRAETPKGEAPNPKAERDQREKAVGNKLGISDEDVQVAQDLRDGKVQKSSLPEAQQERLKAYEKDHGHPPKTAADYMTALYDGSNGSDGKPRHVSSSDIKTAADQVRSDQANADVDAQYKTPPLKPHQGYFQALQELYPGMDGHDLSVLAAKMKAANGGRTVLKEGEQFDVPLSPEQRSEAVGKRSSEIEGNDRDQTDKSYKDESKKAHDALVNAKKDEIQKQRTAAGDPPLNEKDLGKKAEDEVTKDEKDLRQKDAKAAIDEFNTEPQQQVPSIGKLMGLTPEQEKGIKDAQDQGDTRSASDIAVARGWTTKEEADAAMKTQKSLQGAQDKAYTEKEGKDHPDQTSKDSAAAQRKTDGEKAKSDWEAASKQDPTAEKPTMAKLLGLDGAQEDSIKAAQDAGDTRSPEAIAKARGWVSDADIERAKQAQNDMAGEQQQRSQAVDANQQKAVQEFKKDPTKPPSQESMSGLSGEDVKNVQGKQKDGEDFLTAAKRLGFINQQQFDTAEQALKQMDFISKELPSNYSSLLPEQQRAEFMKAVQKLQQQFKPQPAQ